MNFLSIFDVIGPNMIGPSSSHTAGAVSIALLARKMFPEEVKKVTFTLYGSFAKTYHGHGTDRALLGGILGFSTDDERIRDAFSIATERGVEYEYIKKIRASYYLLGALLGKYKTAEVPLPGGCNIGSRPIDQHLKGFRALGASVDILHGAVVAKAEKLTGKHIFLDMVSVGATINIMMAAAMAEAIPPSRTQPESRTWWMWPTS